MVATKTKSAVTARQSARSRAAEKMAERKQREKLISEKLEEFISAGLLIEDAEVRRDEAIAKAHEECAAATAKARAQQIEHALELKGLDLTDREIADLTDLPVSAVREMVKTAKKSAKGEQRAASASSAAESDSPSGSTSSADRAPAEPAAADSQIAS
ncbi:hypothetical protein P9990_25410 (plasmid) [Prescottella equi]|uniref:hypothetical protein n=1 Tax=Rhodococcus hoagii TaxID=43767 RepID=UPI002575F91B|nr:hypothetical protein [Prescottella equi]WJJ14533.1 hypothetical protein P9990_25410 [Prescottella equi]